MLVNWTNQNETRFGNDVMLAQHDAAGSDLFLDDGLAHILDVYPREHLDIWTFGEEIRTDISRLRIFRSVASSRLS